MTTPAARYRECERLMRQEGLTPTAAARRVGVQRSNLRSALGKRGWRFRKIGHGVSLCLHDPDGIATGRELRDDRPPNSAGALMPVDPKMAARVEAARRKGREEAEEAIEKRVQRIMGDGHPEPVARAIVMEGWPS